MATTTIITITTIFLLLLITIFNMATVTLTIIITILTKSPSTSSSLSHHHHLQHGHHQYHHHITVHIIASPTIITRGTATAAAPLSLLCCYKSDTLRKHSDSTYNFHLRNNHTHDRHAAPCRADPMSRCVALKPQGQALGNPIPSSLPQLVIFLTVRTNSEGSLTSGCWGLCAKPSSTDRIKRAVHISASGSKSEMTMKEGLMEKTWYSGNLAAQTCAVCVDSQGGDGQAMLHHCWDWVSYTMTGTMHCGVLMHHLGPIMKPFSLLESFLLSTLEPGTTCRGP
jgi:hypothetical protein